MGFNAFQPLTVSLQRAPLSLVVSWCACPFAAVQTFENYRQVLDNEQLAATAEG